MITTRRASGLPRAARVLPPLAAVALLSGCNASGGTVVTPATVTVTATPSVQAAAPATGTAPATGEATAPPSAPASEPSGDAASATPSGDPAALPRQERTYDVGYLGERTDTPDGTVLTLDRLTVAGVDDAELAEQGTPVRVDDGEVFSNQREQFYEVGVSPEARFFVTTCVAAEAGPSITSDRVDLDTFLADPSLDGTAVSFEYADGLLVRAETNPRC